MTHVSLLHALAGLLLSDFDKTLVDFDSMERIVEQLAPELLPMLVGQPEGPNNYVPLTNTVRAWARGGQGLTMPRPFCYAPTVLEHFCAPPALLEHCSHLLAALLGWRTILFECVTRMSTAAAAATA